MPALSRSKGWVSGTPPETDVVRLAPLQFSPPRPGPPLQQVVVDHLDPLVPHEVACRRRHEEVEVGASHVPAEIDCQRLRVGQFSQPVIYKHFESMEDLIEAIALAGFGRSCRVHRGRLGRAAH